MLSKNRIGKITSSECYKMFESKTVQDTYVEDLKMFNLFAQGDNETDVFNFKWGHLGENFLHDKTDYLKGYVNQNLKSESTIFSKKNTLHCGTPDQYTVFNESLVSSETKSPKTIKGLYNLIFPFYKNGVFQEVDGNEAIKLIEAKSKEGRKYVKQIISNALLLEEELNVSCDYGELIVFMPYDKDIPKLVKYAEDIFETEYYPIMFGTTETLPCIKKVVKDTKDFYDLDDEYRIRDFHRIRFDISQSTKDNFKYTLESFSNRIAPQLTLA